jgi:hypothetical protein
MSAAAHRRLRVTNVVWRDKDGSYTRDAIARYLRVGHKVSSVLGPVNCKRHVSYDRLDDSDSV